MHRRKRKSFLTTALRLAETLATSMNKSFDLNFHCIQEFDIESNAFIVGDKEHDVDCIFQVWKKGETKRKLKSRKCVSDKFKYVKKENKDADFVFRRD